MKTTNEDLQAQMELYDSQIKNLETMKNNYRVAYQHFSGIKNTLFDKLYSLHMDMDMDNCNIIKTGDFNTWNEGDYFKIALSVKGTDKFIFLKSNSAPDNLKEKARKLEEKIKQILPENWMICINYYCMAISTDSGIIIDIWIK